MKVLRGLFIIFVGSLVLVSCNNNDDEQQTNHKYIGVWKLSTFEGGIAGFPETPASSNEILTLTKTKLTLTNNGMTIMQGNYSIEVDEANTGQNKLLLILPGVMTWGITLQDEKLTLDENATYADGFIKHYIRE
jgi:hypothetical protein